MRPKLSSFPLDKPFERLPTDNIIQRSVLRLVADFESDNPQVLGTATAITGHLLLSAKHIFEPLMVRAIANNPAAPTLDQTLTAVQVIPGPQPEYLLWTVMNMWTCDWSDLAVLHLASQHSGTNTAQPHKWAGLLVSPFPPAVGERICGFGYRKSSVTIERDAKNTKHMKLDDEHMAAVGEVVEIHETHRDRSRLTFPCYHVSARFDAGMSGGAVIDETGAVCGLICSGTEGAHDAGAAPISYATTLWPLFRMIIAPDFGPGREVKRFPIIDLARTNAVRVPDLAQLEAYFARHVGPEGSSAPFPMR